VFTADSPFEAVRQRADVLASIRKGQYLFKRPRTKPRDRDRPLQKDQIGRKSSNRSKVPVRRDRSFERVATDDFLERRGVAADRHRGHPRIPRFDPPRGLWKSVFGGAEEPIPFRAGERDVTSVS
jgi:hypothetical protein